MPGDTTARAYERAAAQLTAVSPINGATDHLSAALADPVEMKMLHMLTGDPQRTPTFVMFGHPDYSFRSSGPDVTENPGSAWNHGGIQLDITTTWLGLVGPGVRHQGVDHDTFTDHTDIRPTMLLLAGPADDYRHHGVAIVEDLHESALPHELREDGEAFRALARAYKQIAAPLGGLGRATLAVSTAALAGDDAQYTALEAALAQIGERRDALAAQMIEAIDRASSTAASSASATRGR